MNVSSFAHQRNNCSERKFCVLGAPNVFAGLGNNFSTLRAVKHGKYTCSKHDIGEGEGEDAFFGAKRWDRRSS